MRKEQLQRARNKLFSISFGFPFRNRPAFPKIFEPSAFVYAKSAGLAVPFTPLVVISRRLPIRHHLSRLLCASGDRERHRSTHRDRDDL